MIGPFRGGRTVAVTGVPGKENVFYMAPVNGGVWKTTDYGLTWNPIFDNQPTQSIGALAVAPSDANTLYAGSGEGLLRPDLSTGDGIYKSVDGGAHWNHLGLRDAKQIGAIAIDPRNPNRLFVAALGHPYGPNPQRGVYRSLNGGDTFERVLYQDENTGAVTLALDPADADTVYAALWRARKPPWTNSEPLQIGGGLYKSIDGGTTWHQVQGGLPLTVGRIGIGIAPSNSKRIYALVDSATPALYRSDDGGSTWVRRNTEERITGRGSDFAGVTVDPRNSDVVYVANTSTYRSNDGGSSFTAIKGAPGGDDYHTIWINPRNPQIILLGVDQGATLSVNGGATWSSWYNQPTAQFFHVSTDNRFPYWVYSGQQESGSAGVASRSDYGEISFRQWHPVGAEEYGYVAPDPLHPGIIYGGKVQRYDERTGEVQEVGPELFWRAGRYRFNRTAPLIFSAADPHTLYLGSNVLFATRSGGQHWSVLSPDLTRSNPGVPANLSAFANTAEPRRTHRGVIYSIAPSPLDAKLIWCGTDDGLIWYTADGGRHWNDASPPLSAWSKIAQLDASRFERASAYAAVSRYRLDDDRPYIYRTHDFGKNWKLITAGLPQAGAVNVVRADPIQPGLLFAGTERGIDVSFDDGGHWHSLQLNLPATSMRDLVIHGDDVVVGTHGRSFWILDNISALRQLAAQAERPATGLFRPAVALRIRWNQNTDTPLPPEEPAGKNPPDGAMLDYYLAAPASGQVTLRILDVGGTLVRTFSTTDPPQPDDSATIDKPVYWIRPHARVSAAAGMHRFVWDLRYPPPSVDDHDYAISAIVHDTPRDPRGPLVLPGTYTAVLDIAGKEFRQPLIVRLDPRLHVSGADLRRQLSLARQIVAAVERDTVAIHGARSEETRNHAQAHQGRLLQLLGAVEGADAAPTPALAQTWLTLRGAP